MAKIGSLIFLFLAVVAFAEPSIELTVDQNEVNLGEGFNAQVIVRGSQRAGEPSIDGFGAFESERAGQSSQVQIINGITTLSVVFNYVLLPKTVGTFNLGPARATVGGIAVASDAVQVKVLPGNAPAAAVAGARPEGSKPYMAVAEVDRQSAYLGQQLVYTFQFWTRGAMQNAQVNLPDFKGFVKEELGKQRQFNTVKNGVRWDVSEFKVALFPTQTGDRPIEPASLTGEALVEDPNARGNSPFDDFFDTGFFSRHGQLKRVRLQTSGFLIKVQDLPAAGKPANFSGVVGSLNVRQSVSRTAVAVGDSVTWSVELSGTGNVKDARWEPAQVPAFKTYDDQPTFQLALSGQRVGGTKVFKKALVPLEGGQKEIPAIEIGYFDPEKAAYRVAQAGALKVDVSGQAAPGVAVNAGRQAIAVKGEDILAPRWEMAEIRQDALTTEERTRLLWLWAFGPLGFGLFWSGMTWRRRRLGDTRHLRRSRAYGSFRKASADWKGTPTFDGLDGALRSYLGDRFNTDGAALTSLDVPTKLGSYGVPKDLLKETETVLELCERGRYGGGGDPGQARERIQKLVDGLEKGART